MNKENLFGAQLRKLIDILEIKQYDMAKIAGVARSTVNGYISGKICPSERVVSLIVERLNVSKDWLLYNKGPVFQENEFVCKEIAVANRKAGGCTNPDGFGFYGYCSAV